jgi:hypothetical protein
MCQTRAILYSVCPTPTPQPALVKRTTATSANFISQLYKPTSSINFISQLHQSTSSVNFISQLHQSTSSVNFISRQHQPTRTEIEIIRLTCHFCKIILIYIQNIYNKFAYFLIMNIKYNILIVILLLINSNVSKFFTNLLYVLSIFIILPSPGTVNPLSPDVPEWNLPCPRNRWITLGRFSA